MNPQIFISINMLASISAFFLYCYLLLNYNNECADKNMFIKLRSLILLNIFLIFISILSYKLRNYTKYFLIVIPIIGILMFILYINILFNFKNCEIFNSERVVISTITTTCVLICSLSMLAYYIYNKKITSFFPREKYLKVLDSHKNLNIKKKTINIEPNIPTPQNAIKNDDDEEFYDASDDFEADINEEFDDLK